ncbi:DTW domain-containing protein YfiP [Pseudoduganella lurida]|uniref:tRNA-uridine aminocarboxypropyltransferase n=1 Tax=Pseudoduganella lurida TaxID=1036180 RepID=A0A562RBK5_9BURK|nr:tRNA-uridine aminocarboxypropyltransferase [Pseudoduganella lurida]TWI66449.1 DTW domain-containing protein YfiP [Pseudoduganella lurida]
MNDVIRRPQCITCLRPASHCICGCIRPVDDAGTGRAPVLILQHPLEVTNVKNSARLLHLCLPGSTLVTGEAFEPAALAALLAGPRRAVLLYPDTPGDRSLGIAPPPTYEPADAEELLLVVLDATWRKSRKMLYLNPALQALPRLALQDVPPSRYLVRKAHAPGQLSTLEATAYALAQIEADEKKFAPLIDAFDCFVGRLQAAEAAHRHAG